MPKFKLDGGYKLICLASYLKLIFKSTDQVLDKGVSIVSPRIGVDREEVIVYEVVASHGDYIVCLREELICLLGANLHPHELLYSFKQLDLFVQREPLNLQRYETSN